DPHFRCSKWRRVGGPRNRMGRRGSGGQQPSGRGARYSRNSDAEVEVHDNFLHVSAPDGRLSKHVHEIREIAVYVDSHNLQDSTESWLVITDHYNEDQMLRFPGFQLAQETFNLIVESLEKRF